MKLSVVSRPRSAWSRISSSSSIDAAPRSWPVKIRAKPSSNASRVFASPSRRRPVKAENNFTTSTAVGLYQSLFGFALVMTANWVVRRINKDYALF